MNSPAFRFAAIVALGGLVFGLDAALISCTVIFFTSHVGLSDLLVGTVVCAPGFVVLFALPVVGYLADKIGRKRMLQLIAVMYLISAIGSALAPSFYALVAARFLGGLAFASISMASMYIGEIAPPENRGKLVGMNQINIVVGLSAAYFVNYLLVNNAESLGVSENIWRWMSGSESIPAFFWFLLLFTIPQSPRWLMLMARKDEARNVLQRLLPAERVEKSLEEIQASLTQSGPQLNFSQQLNENLKPEISIMI